MQHIHVYQHLRVRFNHYKIMHPRLLLLAGTAPPFSQQAELGGTQRSQASHLLVEAVGGGTVSSLSYRFLDEQPRSSQSHSASDWYSYLHRSVLIVYAQVLSLITHLKQKCSIVSTENSERGVYVPRASLASHSTKAMNLPHPSHLILPFLHTILISC